MARFVLPWNAKCTPIQKISERFKCIQKICQHAPMHDAVFNIDGNGSGDRSQPTRTGPRILVVDDNDDNRYTLTLHLEGYSNLETAQDGEEAIARLDEAEFDLGLLDVMMPKVDGYQVLTWVKEQPRQQVSTGLSSYL